MRKLNVFVPLLILLILCLPSCKKVAEIIKKEIGIFVGDIAQNIVETDSDGANFSLDSLTGKVILLNFSTMWCGPCRMEAGELMELYNRYKERGFEIVQCIYQDEDRNPSNPNDLKRWINEFKANYKVLNDPDRSSVDLYQFSSIPFNVIIDRDFTIQYRTSGFSKNEVEDIIESYL